MCHSGKTGYEIYSEPQLREWWIRALAAGDTRGSAIYERAIMNKRIIDAANHDTTTLVDPVECVTEEG